MTFPLSCLATEPTDPPISRSYSLGLNTQQRAALDITQGPLLILAGAGTGKTRVLVARIAHVLATQNVAPWHILAVTFTNKAAREMKERIIAHVGPAAEQMSWLGTFHSIGTKILRRHAELAGLRSNFTILNYDDQLRLLKQIIQAEHLDEKRWPPRALAHIIDDWKNRALAPSDVPKGEAQAFGFGKGIHLYEIYEERLRALNAVDFGGLLLKPLQLFRNHSDILRHYQSTFRHILVDEYQDTNVVQYLWLRLLAQEHHNICCVGDDDQSIYGWRGAEVDNILRFEHDFPDARILRLEQNYRSTGHILGAASHLIAHNRNRLGKTLHTEEDLGEQVCVTGTWDSGEEARFISDTIEHLQRDGMRLSSCAILVRLSAQMREIEDRFVQIGLPYRVIGGPRFYERAEIRDALAYFRCVVSRNDDLAFERIINLPKRGLGDATLQILHDYGRAESVSLHEAAQALVETEELRPAVRRSLGSLLDSFQRWSQHLASLPPRDLAAMILEESGYTDMWQAQRSPDAVGRLDNLKELLRSLEEFEDLPSFLEHVALVMEAVDTDTTDRVSLMTLHAAKGLEFDTVFLPGWEEGLFPHQKALEEKGASGLEEERRLAHVGLTRARRRAFISFASNRRLHGFWTGTTPSRFVSELPAQHIRMDECVSYYGHPSRSRTFLNRDQDFDEPHSYSNKPYKSDARLSERVINPLGQKDDLWRIGERVTHNKFGLGTVVSVNGNRLSVDFDRGGQKMILAHFLSRE
jgi:DNA helicase-2/ATP-dependent DNA helicase PcrA